MYDGNLLPCNLLFSFFDAGVNKYDCRFSNIDYILKKLRFIYFPSFISSKRIEDFQIVHFKYAKFCILDECIDS